MNIFGRMASALVSLVPTPFCQRDTNIRGAIGKVDPEINAHHSIKSSFFVGLFLGLMLIPQ